MTLSDSMEQAHKAVFELLPWYVNDSLNSSEKQQVDRHLKRCEICRAEANFLAQTQSALAAIPDHIPSPTNGLNTVLDRIEAETNGSSNKTPSLASVSSLESSVERETAVQEFGAARRVEKIVVSRLKYLRDYFNPRWAVAAVAVVFSTVVAVQLVNSPQESQPTGEFTVLSSSNDQGSLRLRVELGTDVILESTKVKILTELNAPSTQVKWIRQDEGGYVLELPESLFNPERQLGELTQRIHRVSQLPDVVDVELVP